MRESLCSVVVGRWLIPTTAACVMLAGCGDSPTHPVSGKVTLDNKPLADAFVSFVHTGDARQSAVATTDSEGRFVIKVADAAVGMNPGEYEVRISTYRDANLDAEPPQPEVRERVPEKYNLESALRAEVVADQPNVFDFELTSR